MRTESSESSTYKMYFKVFYKIPDHTNNKTFNKILWDAVTGRWRQTGAWLSSEMAILSGDFVWRSKSPGGFRVERKPVKVITDDSPYRWRWRCHWCGLEFLQNSTYLLFKLSVHWTFLKVSPRSAELFLRADVDVASPFQWGLIWCCTSLRTFLQLQHKPTWSVSSSSSAGHGSLTQVC